MLKNEVLATLTIEKLLLLHLGDIQNNERMQTGPGNMNVILSCILSILSVYDTSSYMFTLALKQ